MKTFNWTGNALVFTTISIPDRTAPYRIGQLINLAQGPGTIADLRYFRTKSDAGIQVIVAEVVAEIAL